MLKFSRWTPTSCALRSHSKFSSHRRQKRKTQEELFVPSKGWAEMICKVCEIDPLLCSSCGGKWHIYFQHDRFISAYQWEKIVNFFPDRENEFPMFRVFGFYDDWRGRDRCRLENAPVSGCDYGHLRCWICSLTLDRPQKRGRRYISDDVHPHNCKLCPLLKAVFVLYIISHWLSWFFLPIELGYLNAE